MNVQEYNEENRICLMAAMIFAGGQARPEDCDGISSKECVAVAMNLEKIVSKELRARREAE